LYPIFFSSAHLVGSIVLKSGPAWQVDSVYKKIKMIKNYIKKIKN
jgi:hypothetical protein